MDPAILAALGELLSHGGSIGTLVAVFILGRLSTKATNAFDTLARIETLLRASHAESKRIGTDLDNRTKRIDTAIQSLPLAIVRARRDAGLGP